MSHCVLSPDSANNADVNSNKLFLLSKTQNYVSVVTLLTKSNQKLSKLRTTARNFLKGGKKYLKMLATILW